MCTANLYVSEQPCQHRWYTMLSPCSPSTDLSSCKCRVKLKGWEIKVPDCPWCVAAKPSPATHRLLDSTTARRASAASSVSDCCPRGRGDSLSPHTSRDGSADSLDSEGDSPEARRAERNKLSNARINAYIGNAAPFPSRVAYAVDSAAAPPAKSSLLSRWGSKKR